MNQRGEIYAGGFNELGIIKRNEQGKYYYESLVNLLRPEDRNLENIWRYRALAGGFYIFKHEYVMLFRSPQARGRVRASP